MYFNLLTVLIVVAVVVTPLFLCPASSVRLSSPPDLTEYLNQICLECNKFLLCHSSPLRGFEFAGGRNGLGVMATIFNKGTDIDIYKNCEGLDDDPSKPKLTKQCILSPAETPRVEVFIKMVSRETELRNKAFQQDRTSSTKCKTAMEKEVERSRAAARIFVDGTVIGPSVYDLVHHDTRDLHGIQNQAYLQEKINGPTTFQILNHAIVGIYSRLEEVDLRNLENLSKGENISEERDVKIKVAKSTAIVEMWHRHRVMLVTMFTAMARVGELMKAGYLHCDLHSANMMHISLEEHDVDRAVGSLMDGTAVFLSKSAQNLSYRDEVDLRQQLLQLHSNFASPQKFSISLVPILSRFIRFIDNAYLLRVPGEQEQENEPCKTWRASSEEDLNAIYRATFAKPLDDKLLRFPSTRRFKENKLLLPVLSEIREKFEVLMLHREQLLSTIKGVEEVDGCLKKKVCSLSTMRQGVEKIQAALRSKIDLAEHQIDAEAELLRQVLAEAASHDGYDAA